MKTTEFICSVCVERLKRAGHLMCPECLAYYEEEAAKMRGCLVDPETRFSYTIKATKENLVLYRKKLESQKHSVEKHWNTAYKATRDKYRGYRLKPDVFQACVDVKFKETLEKAGLQQVGKTIDDLKNKIRLLEQQMRWLKKIAARRKTKAEAEKKKTKNAGEVRHAMEKIAAT